MSEKEKQVLKESFLNALNSRKTKKDLMTFDCPDISLEDFPELHELYLEYCIQKKELVDFMEFQENVFKEIKDGRVITMFLICLSRFLSKDLFKEDLDKGLPKEDLIKKYSCIEMNLEGFDDIKDIYISYCIKKKELIGKKEFINYCIDYIIKHKDDELCKKIENWFKYLLEKLYHQK